MDDFVLALRAIVVCVLMISGIAKLFDPEGSEDALAGFGVPLAWTGPASLVLPWIELVLAGGLLFAVTLPAASLLTSILFLIFTVIVAKAILAGEHLDCHCFGQLQSAPISWFTVARNAILSIMALMVVWWSIAGGSTAIWSDVTARKVGVAGIAITFTAMTWVIWRQRQTVHELGQQIAVLHEQITTHRVPASASSLAFAAIAANQWVVDEQGETVEASQLHKQKAPTLLVFVSSSCKACQALMPRIGEWQAEFGNLMNINMIGYGDEADMRESAKVKGANHLYLRSDDALVTALGVNGQPSAVLIDHDGYIRQKPKLGGTAICSLVEDLRVQAGMA